MTGHGSVEAVIAAIQEDAHAEIERMEAEGASAIARLRQEDAATPVAVADADSRIAGARRQARTLAAEEDWADRHATLDAREQWVARVVEAGMDRLRRADAAIRREELVHLAREAIGRIPGHHVALSIAPRDLPLTRDPAWTADLAIPDGIEVSITTAETIDGGCIARSADGRLSFDNTYAARARRLEPIWRQTLIDLAERPQAVSRPS